MIANSIGPAIEDFDYQPRMAAMAPTQARPGSAEKIEVMRRRVANGEYLHHPDDAGQKVRRSSWAELHFRDDDEPTSSPVLPHRTKKPGDAQPAAAPASDNLQQPDTESPMRHTESSPAAAMPELDPAIANSAAAVLPGDIEVALDLLINNQAQVLRVIETKIVQHRQAITSHRHQIQRLQVVRELVRPEQRSDKSRAQPIERKSFLLALEARIIAELKKLGRGAKALELAELIKVTQQQIGRAVSVSSKLCRVKTDAGRLIQLDEDSKS